MDPNEKTAPTDTPAPETEEQAQQPAPPEDQNAPATDVAQDTLKAMLGDAAPAEDAKPEESTPQVAPELSKPGTQKQADDAPKPADAQAEVAAEVSALGLKEKAAQRFHELAAKAAEAEQLRPIAERLGQWEERILSTGANPEQFGHAMNYLTLLNSGDPANLELAFQQIEGEYHALARALGKPAGGAIDPLVDHPDLAEKVANIEMDRETAMEVASMRAQMRLREASTQARTQQDELQRAHAGGAAQLAALEAELRAQDPAGYDSRLRALTPAIQEAVRTLPPDRWAPFTRTLFAATAPATPVQTTAQPSGVTPLRATVPSAAAVRRVTDAAEATLAAMLSVGK